MTKTQFVSKLLLILLLPLSLFIWSCGNTGEKTPDVSSIKIDLHTARFDKDFSEIDTNHIGQGLQKLYTKYPDFLNYYLDTFEAFGINRNYSDTSKAVRDSLKPYLVFKDFVNLENTIKEHYPDTKDIDAQLTQGFRYMKHYFPGYYVPRIIYLNSYLGSKWPTFPLDSTTLCIGLDLFLGDQFPFYASNGIPPYMMPHLRKSYMPVSVFHTVYQTMRPFSNSDKTLLDLMLQHGKEQYFLHKILPGTPDSVLSGTPQHKLDWCAENEGLIYNFFTRDRLLYNKEPSSIMPYVTDGPFAVNFPVTDPQYNTPGNIGTWLGYKIVCSWMAQQPSTTLQQLLVQQIDAAQFLDAARYRPK
jgi:hypothetical protein